MRRREFIRGLGGAAVAWPTLARAQQAERVGRVSLLYPYPEGGSFLAERVAALRQGLTQFGWTEGRNLRIDLYPGPQEQIDDRAAEVVRSAPNVIVVFAVPATRAVQQQTRTIPIVAVAFGDPEARGLVKSIARPEGNLTGFSAFPSLGGKWVQLLKAVVPQMSRIAMVSDIGLLVPGRINGLIPPIEAAAKEMGIEAVRIAVRTPVEAAVAIRAFAERPNGGLAVVQPIGTLEEAVISLATEHKLPSIGISRVEVDLGTLLAYGADTISMFRDAATYVDRILRGAKVADLPVQFPTRYALIVNLKTARALGLTIPPSILVLADEVIE